MCGIYVRRKEKNVGGARRRERKRRVTTTTGGEREGRKREREGPGVGPEGYVGVAPRPEAARHLGHPYIAKYSRIEKGAIVRM